MSDTQKELYSRIYAHSKSMWDEHLNDAKKNKTSAKAALKLPTRGVVEDKNGKTLSMHAFLSNILMQLRKTANHPVLYRAFYNDETIKEISEEAHNIIPKFQELTIDESVQEITKMSDWEINGLCTKLPKVSHHCLNRGIA